MASKESRTRAIELLATPRGGYIVAQALYHGIKVLEAVDTPHRELSNIADMRLMQELFAFPDVAVESVDIETLKKGGA